MNSVNIKKRIPDIYIEFSEIDALCQANQTQFELGQEEFSNLQKNQWIITANEAGIKEYENSLDILPSIFDSLDLRKSRLISKLSTAPPDTFPYLIQKLKNFLGTENFNVTVTPEEYRIHFLVHVGERNKLNELLKLLFETLPANLIKVVHNDILCYNNTKRYVVQGLTFSSIYSLN